MRHNQEVTMIGTLPPLKGNAYYCWALSHELAKEIKVNFISFKKLYPEFLYPGGTLDNDPKFSVSPNQNLKINRLLTYYNPFSWIFAGLIARGKLVHAHWWSLPVAPVWIVIFAILKIRRKKILLTVHNVLPHEKTRFDTIITHLVFKLVDLYFVHSDKNVEQMERILGIPESKIVQIPMGIHSMYKGAAKTREEARKKLDLPLDSKIILSFGNIREYKGVDDLIKAVSILKSKIPDNLYFLVVGKPWLDWRNYDRLIKEYGIEKITKTYLDYIPMSDVDTFFISSDLVVLPYKDFEAQSGVGNIAIAFHKPLIVSNVGGLPDLVKNKDFVVEPNNPVILAEKIFELLSDARLSKESAQHSRDLCKKYSWKTIADKTLTVYKRLHM